MTHVRTSPFYPQSNGKLEALNKTAKKEVIRPCSPRTYEEAKTQLEEWVEHYNNVRLHSSINYAPPITMLDDRAVEILEQRDRRLDAARSQRAGKKEPNSNNLKEKPSIIKINLNNTEGAQMIM